MVVILKSTKKHKVKKITNRTRNSRLLQIRYVVVISAETMERICEYIAFPFAIIYVLTIEVSTMSWSFILLAFY
jgi:hypothetical protein